MRSGRDRRLRSTLTRLKPDRIVIIGGTDVISAGVETDLAAFASQVDRLGGSDRYATAAAVSQAFFPATIGGIPPLPSCAEDQGIKKQGGVWVCVDPADPELPSCAEDQGIVQQGGVWVCADLAPPPAAEPSGTLKHVTWEAWDFVSDPNLLGNDDACGFTRLIDLDGSGGVDHYAVAAPVGEEGGLLEYKSAFMVTGEIDVQCRDACAADPQCAAAVFTEHNDASGEGVCHFTRHTTLDSSFTRFCTNPALCATAITLNPRNFISFTKCEANSP